MVDPTSRTGYRQSEEWLLDTEGINLQVCTSVDAHECQGLFLTTTRCRYVISECIRRMHISVRPGYRSNILHRLRTSGSILAVSNDDCTTLFGPV